MAQRVLKEKRKKEDERRRHEKLEELFDKCDPNEDCRVRINALREMHKELDLDFDEETVQDIISDREMMTKVEFVKFGVNTKLVENVEKATIIGPTSDNWERTGDAENYNHPIFLEVVDEIKMESMEI